MSLITPKTPLELDLAAKDIRVLQCAEAAHHLAANAALDALSLPEFPNRAPVEVDRADIIFDGEAFVLVPSPEAPVPAPLAD